ncbi:leucine-rich repeat protein [Ruminococcus flavefaciens]|uniref:leucine-rich repeat protein n=1 Tax=Ruminococcus flavefaciens TaxID=1265 RepID=UPI0026F0633C|nr:leucine-rich repeat protein [Ruminococcus flavefaciens]
MKLSKIHAFLTAACLTVCLAPAAFEDIHANAIYYAWTEAEDSDYIDDIHYDFFSDHVVVRYCEKGGDIVIPAEIEGLPVTDIFDGAFYSEEITSIVLPDSVREISEHMCAGCPNLRSIKLPANITSIPEHAFSDCRSLEKINIPSGVTEIGRFAFYGCKSLKEVKLPEELEILEDNCFCDCSLESVTIPKGVTEMPNRCFGGNSFKELTIPETVKKIDGWAFYECYNLEKLTVLNPQCDIESRLDFVFGGGRRDENGEPTEKRVPCTCYGYKGSTLEKLANESTAKSAGFTFVALDAEKTVSLGDPNGDGKINAVDASIILSNYARFSTSDEKPTADETASCDVNKDGKINAVDASTVLTYYAYCATNEAVAFEDFLKK